MELIDGHPVVEHQIRFRLRTIIDERYAEQIRDGETMVWIVRARCTPPQYYPLGKEADERYKLAVQNVEAAAPLDGEARVSALAYLDGAGDQLVLPFVGEEDELTELRSLLVGDLREDEGLIDAVRRLLGKEPNALVIEEPPLAEVPPQREDEKPEPDPTDTEDLDGRLDDPEYAAAYARATAVLRDEEPSPSPPSRPGVIPSMLPDARDVEVVGSLRRGGRSNLSELIDSKFGEP